MNAMQQQTPTPTAPLKLVPFNEAWIAHDKIDVHAIYRRPVFKDDDYGEPQRSYDKVTGLPLWDLTGPLPVKQHNKWRAKGFEYVTLADKQSLFVAGRNNTIEGNWRQYDQHRQGGPWNYKLYDAGQISEQTKAAAQLESDVNRFGSEAVESIRRQQEPSFELPARLRGIHPGGARFDGASQATTDVTTEVEAVAVAGQKKGRA